MLKLNAVNLLLFLGLWLIPGAFSPSLGARMTFQRSVAGINVGSFKLKQTVHVFSIDGEIVDGDAEQFIELSSRYYSQTHDQSALVILNSEGGSFEEGLKLLNIFINGGFLTYVKKDAVCNSACAIAFLGGTLVEWQTDADSAIARMMEPGAKIGFHRPSLSVELPEAEYKRSNVEQAYADAYASSAAQIGLLLEYSRIPNIRSSLIAEMLKTKDGFYYIDTVNKAGRWDIDVVGVKFPSNPNRDQIYLACMNLVGWSQDNFAEGATLPRLDNGKETSPSRLQDRRTTRGGKVYVDLDTLQANVCVIQERKSDADYSRFSGEAYTRYGTAEQAINDLDKIALYGTRMKPIYFYNGEASLVSLPRTSGTELSLGSD